MNCHQQVHTSFWQILLISFLVIVLIDVMAYQIGFWGAWGAKNGSK